MTLPSFPQNQVINPKASLPMSPLWIAWFNAVQTQANPKGAVTVPGVAASGTPVTNTTGFNCMVYIQGGTISGVSVSGITIFTGTPGQLSVLVPAGQSITLTYTVAPTWQWIAI